MPILSEFELSTKNLCLDMTVSFFLAFSFFFFLTEAKSLIAAQLVQSFPAFAQGVVSHRFVLQFFFPLVSVP